MNTTGNKNLTEYIKELREELLHLKKAQDYLTGSGRILLEALQCMEDLLCHADSAEAWLEMANGKLNSDQKIEALGWLLRLRRIAANEQKI